MNVTAFFGLWGLVSIVFRLSSPQVDLRQRRQQGCAYLGFPTFLYFNPQCSNVLGSNSPRRLYSLKVGGFSQEPISLFLWPVADPSAPHPLFLIQE